MPIITWFTLLNGYYGQRRRQFLIEMGYLSPNGCLTPEGLHLIKALWRYHYYRSSRDRRIFLEHVQRITPCPEIDSEFRKFIAEIQASKGQALSLNG